MLPPKDLDQQIIWNRITWHVESREDVMQVKNIVSPKSMTQTNSNSLAIPTMGVTGYVRRLMHWYMRKDWPIHFFIFSLNYTLTTIIELKMDPRFLLLIIILSHWMPKIT